MTLPRRAPKKDKRSTRWRSQKHCNWLRGFICANEAMGMCDGAREVAHVRMGSGAGMGQKPHDYRAVPLCKACHSWQHNLGEPSFWEDYQLRTGQSLDTLLEDLEKASPVSHEIAQHKREVGQ